MEQETKKLTFGRLFFLAILLIVLVTMVRQVLPALELGREYHEIHDQTLTVTAEITKITHHTDSDDDDYYKMYITYTAGGTEYRDIYYDQSSASKTPQRQGEKLTVELNPEDPGVPVKTMLNTIKNGAGFCLPVALLLLGAIAAVWKDALLNPRQAGRPSREEVEAQLKTMVVARIPQYLLPLMGAAELWVCSVTAPALGVGFRIFGWAALIIGGICLLISAQDLRKIRSGQFTMQWDTLVEKKVDTSGDSDSYILVYSGGDRTWTRSVPHRVFNNAQEGQIVLAVYLEGTKHPILHYIT